MASFNKVKWYKITEGEDTVAKPKTHVVPFNTPTIKSWGYVVPKQWVRARSAFVTDGYGIKQALRPAFSDAMVYALLYRADDGNALTTFATGLFNFSSFSSLNSLHAQMSVPDGDCTCTMALTYPENLSGVEFVVTPCSAHPTKPMTTTLSEVAQRVLWRGWATRDPNAWEALAHKANGVNLSVFIEAWSMWLSAHGFRQPPQQVAKAMSWVPAMYLPPFVEFAPGLHTPPAMTAWGADKAALTALASKVFEHVDPKNVTASYPLGKFATLYAPNAGVPWYNKVKTHSDALDSKPAKTAKFASGGEIPGYKVEKYPDLSESEFEFTLDQVSGLTAGNFTFTATPYGTVKKDELTVDIGAGRTLRFYKTEDGRLDVEFAGGGDEDVSTRAMLLLSSVAAMIDAKAPKDIDNHGPDLHSWLTTNVGVKLKTVEGGVSPGTYYISPPTEALLKSTFTSTNAPAAPMLITSGYTLSPQAEPYAKLLMEAGLSVQITSQAPDDDIPTPTPTLYCTVVGLQVLATNAVGVEKVKAWLEDNPHKVMTSDVVVQLLEKDKPKKKWAPKGEGYTVPNGKSLGHGGKKFAALLNAAGVNVYACGIFDSMPDKGTYDEPMLFVTPGALTSMGFEDNGITVDDVKAWLKTHPHAKMTKNAVDNIIFHKPVKAEAGDPVAKLTNAMKNYYNLDFYLVPDAGFDDVTFYYTSDPHSLDCVIAVTTPAMKELATAWSSGTFTIGMLANYAKGVHATALDQAKDGKVVIPVLGEDAVATVVNSNPPTKPKPKSAKAKKKSSIFDDITVA